MEDLVNVVSTVYEPKRYFDRVLRLSKQLKPVSRHRPRWFAIKRDLVAFVKLSWAMTKDSETRYYFWRNLLAAIRLGAAGFGTMVELMGAYLHFKNQVRSRVTEVRRQIPIAAEKDRKLAELDGESHNLELVILHDHCA